jgi:hypothetical protein
MRPPSPALLIQILVGPGRQILVGLVRGMTRRNFQHAGDGRNPDENRHGASFHYVAGAAVLPGFDHQDNQGNETVHSTEVEPHAAFCLRKAYLGLGSIMVRLAHEALAVAERHSSSIRRRLPIRWPQRRHIALVPQNSHRLTASYVVSSLVPSQAQWPV